MINYTLNSIVTGKLVKIRIWDKDSYAVDCAESLDGKTGFVEKIGSHSNPDKVLVTFHTTPKKWWPHQTISNPFSFWFDADELVPINS